MVLFFIETPEGAHVINRDKSACTTCGAWGTVVVQVVFATFIYPSTAKRC